MPPTERPRVNELQGTLLEPWLVTMFCLISLKKFTVKKKSLLLTLAYGLISTLIRTEVSLTNWIIT